MIRDWSAFKRKVKNRQFAIDNAWRGGNKTLTDGFVGNRSDPQWELLNDNLADARSCSFFNGYWPIVSGRKYIGKAVVFGKKVIRKLLKIFLGWYLFPIYQRQSHFNGKMVNVASLQRDLLAQLSQRMDRAEQLCAQLREQNQALDNKVAQTQAALTQAQAALTQTQAALVQAQECNIRTQAQLEQTQNQLQKLQQLPTDDDRFYHSFEERFRGPREVIRDRLQAYVPLLQERLPDWSGRRFVDIGSGRGEWLDILRDNGAADYVGVDLNERQNSICRSHGHTAISGDCLQYLADQPEKSVDLITGFQIIEHLTPCDFVKLLQDCYRVLKPGGAVLFETPNPNNLIVAANTFYYDFSHKRLLNPALAVFLAQWCGFTDAISIDANSDPRWVGITEETERTNPELLRQFNDIKWQMYGPQDYALFAVKE